MKIFKEMNLEETMKALYTNIRMMRIEGMIIALLCIGLAFYSIFNSETVPTIMWAIILLISSISSQISHSSLNAKAIAKLYEKIMKDEKM